MPPHVNLSSFAGGGKTTIAMLLLKNYRTVVIPKVTTRPRRAQEQIPEYIYLSGEEFVERKKNGHFISVTGNGEFHHAIPHVEHWPIIPEGTELVLSIFGSEARLVQKYIPYLKLCFISIRDRNVLAERLLRRCEIDGGNFPEKSAKNEIYFAQGIEALYDFVVYNDTTPEECVAQIIEIIKR